MAQWFGKKLHAILERLQEQFDLQYDLKKQKNKNQAPVLIDLKQAHLSFHWHLLHKKLLQLIQGDTEPVPELVNRYNLSSVSWFCPGLFPAGHGSGA